MSYTDKKELVKLVTAFSTFDGGLYKRGKGNARFILNMRAENRDYLEWVYQVLSGITSVSLKERTDYNTDRYCRSPQLRLETKCHPFFTKIHNRVYIDRHKVIDPHFLKLMDAEVLAIAFMCDGGSKVYKSKRSVRYSSSIILNTKGFSYGDNLILSKAIYESTGIRTKIHKQNHYRYLSVPVKDHRKFVDAVRPFMCNSFLYKLERLAPAWWWDDDIV